jgi:hypothetical protein
MIGFLPLSHTLQPSWIASSRIITHGFRDDKRKSIFCVHCLSRAVKSPSASRAPDSYRSLPAPAERHTRFSNSPCSLDLRELGARGIIKGAAAETRVESIARAA